MTCSIKEVYELKQQRRMVTLWALRGGQWAAGVKDRQVYLRKQVYSHCRKPG